MHARAQEITSAALRRGGQCAVIVIRLYELESIEDRFGHIMRDRAIRAFSAVLRKAANEYDLCGRNVDDGFLYLMDRNAGPAAVVAACERLSRDLSFDVNFEKAEFRLTPRIGAAMCPIDGSDPEALLAAASSACDRASRSGENFATASPILNEGDLASASAMRGASGESRLESAEPSGLLVNRQTDRRAVVRRRVFKRGKILTNGQGSVVDCMLRDLSDRGARLRVNPLYAPPDQFELLIVDSGAKLTVDVRWRAGDDIGVQFRV